MDELTNAFDLRTSAMIKFKNDWIIFAAINAGMRGIIVPDKLSIAITVSIELFQASLASTRRKLLATLLAIALIAILVPHRFVEILFAVFPFVAF